MKYIIIAAFSENRVIGNKGSIPWHFPEDLKFFKKQTVGNSVLMGRKTYDSLPDKVKPLPGRDCLILTRDRNYNEKGVSIFYDKESLQKRVETLEKVYVAGGAEIYSMFLPLASQMIITLIPGVFEGDTFFPPWNKENWNLHNQSSKEGLVHQVWNKEI